MKKVLMLSLFAMAALVSQAWAAECTSTGGGNHCQFSNGCFKMSTEYSDGKGCTKPNCTCAQVIENCTLYGSVYKGVTGTDVEPYGDGWKCSEHSGTWTNEGANPNRTVLGCCKWSTESTCYPIWSDKEEDVASCKSGTNSFWSGECPASGCPSGTPVYDGSANDCGEHYCKWETGCVRISPDPENGITTCDAAITNCQNYGEYFTNSTCSGSPQNPSPIKFTPASQAFIVAPFGRSLHISSPRDATVSLYDMSGAKVYSGRVHAGNSVFGLEKVASGSYYAVVQSGSNYKKVPVILK